MDWAPDPRYSAHGEIRAPLDPEASNKPTPGMFRPIDRGLFAGVYGPSPIPLEEQRKVPGFENVVVAVSLGGRSFFSLGYDMALCEDSLRIPGFNNLFCADDKAGTRGVQSGINMGYLAGHNAVRAGG